MASKFFKLADRRYFVLALESSLSHGGLSSYESRLGLDTEDGDTKKGRALRIVRHIFESIEESDAAILDMLDHLYVESTSSIHLDRDETYKLLQAEVLRPRGVELTDDGFVLDGAPKSFISAVPPANTQWPKPSSGSNNSGIGFTFPGVGDSGTPINSSAPRSGLSGFGAPSTMSAASTPTTFTTLGRSVAMTAEKKNNLVFVVHGRDRRPVEAVEQFLQFSGLKMLSWTEAVNLTRESQPHTFDIVKAGMDAAAAIIVIFSPDDQARLNPALTNGVAQEEPKGQPRQNVLLEAGMAFAYARNRTIFIQSEPIRPISDIEGFNWVKLDGKWDSRKDLLNRLNHAGAFIQLHDENLTHRLAGDFKVS